MSEFEVRFFEYLFMRKAGHKASLEIIAVTFYFKYVHIKCVIYVTSYNGFCSNSLLQGKEEA
jgi:hypothetical protein